MVKVPDVPLETWKPLYAEAQCFTRSEPWRRIDESLFFGVQDPAAGQMGYACILGSFGEFLALCVYRGSEAFQIYRDMLAEELSSDGDSGFLQDCLMAQFADQKHVEKADRKVIRALGLRLGGSKAFPLFRSYRPGYLPWHLDEREAVFLTFALHCACDWGEKVSSGILKTADHPGQVFTYLPKTGKTQEVPGYENVWTPLPVNVSPQPPTLDAARLAKLQAQSLRKGGVWEAEVVYLPATIMDRDRPYHVRLVMLVDRDSGFMLPGGVVPPEMSSPQLLVDALSSAIEETKRLPAEIIMRDKSAASALEAVGKMLGIQIKVGGFRALAQAKKAILNRFAGRR